MVHSDLRRCTRPGKRRSPLDYAVWEQLEYVPQATRQPREHVYRVRLNDQEMAILQKLAKQRGVPASVIIRELVREQGLS